MIQRRIGVHLASFRVPLKKALHMAARLGADAVEFEAQGVLSPREFTQTGLREFRKLLADLRLGVSCVGFHTRRGYHVADQLDARVAATKEALQFAYQLGGAYVVNRIGHASPEEDAAGWQRQQEALLDLGRHGQHVGATLLAETGNDAPEELAQVLQSIPEGMLGIDLNPGLLVMNGLSPSDAVRVLGSSIRHVHANDAVRDLSRGRGVEVRLGRGSVDFPELWAALVERDYQGDVTIVRDYPENPEQEIADAVQYLRSLGS